MSIHMNKEAEEKFNEIIPSIMNRLVSIDEILNGPLSDDLNFTNGNGYVQHDVDIVVEMTRDLITFAYKQGYLGDGKLLDSLEDYIHTKNFRQNSVIGRYLGDTPFYIHWYRLVCIDYNGREYAQPYYALNPHELNTDECYNKHVRSEKIRILLEE